MFLLTNPIVIFTMMALMHIVFIKEYRVLHPYNWTDSEKAKIAGAIATIAFALVLIVFQRGGLFSFILHNGFALWALWRIMITIRDMAERIKRIEVFVLESEYEDDAAESAAIHRQLALMGYRGRFKYFRTGNTLHEGTNDFTQYTAERE